MKKSIIASYVSIAVCATLIFSCAQEVNPEEVKDILREDDIAITNDVQIIADCENATKTFIADDNNGGYLSKWRLTDEVGFFQVYEKGGETKYIDKITETPSSLTNYNRKASFTVALSYVEGGSNYKYVAVYPAGAVTRNEGDLDLVIPSTQTFGTTTFDPNADVMVSERVDRASYSSDALEMGFARVGTIIGLTIKGLTAGETVDKVIISTTEDGKYLAGTIKYDISAKDLKDGLTNASQTLTLNAPSSTVVPAGGNLTVWFRCAAVELSDNFKVAVATTNGINHYNYYKIVDLATPGKTVDFKNGHLGKLSVGSLTKRLADGYYVIRLIDGDLGYDLVMSAESGGNDYRGSIDNPFTPELDGSIDASTNLNAAWLVSCDESTDQYTFYSPGAEKYLKTSSNKLYLDDLANATGYYIGSNTSGDYTGTYSVYNTAAHTDRHIGYNSSSPRFNLYTGDFDGTYKGYLTFTPAFFAPVVSYSNITLGTNAAVSEAVTVNPTKFSFTNTISLVGVYSNDAMTTPTDWLSVSVTNSATGALSYTATENTGSVRKAWVKLHAEGDDGDIYVSFTVQQAAPGGPEKGDTKTYSISNSGTNAASFNKLIWNGTSGENFSHVTSKSVTINSDAWSITTSGEGEVVYAAGQQLGAAVKKNTTIERGITGLTMITSAYTAGIETIKVTTKANGTSPTLKAYLNDVQIGSSKSLSSTSTEYTFTLDSVSAGEIKLVWSQTSSAKYIVVESIVIN